MQLLEAKRRKENLDAEREATVQASDSRSSQVLDNMFRQCNRSK